MKLEEAKRKKETLDEDIQALLNKFTKDVGLVVSQIDLKVVRALGASEIKEGYFAKYLCETEVRI